MAPKFSEIPPLFKADRRTVLAFEPKDGKIIVNYAGWDQNKVALEGQVEGQDFVVSLGPQGLEGRILDRRRDGRHT